jgi:hypothetical protein
MDPLLPQILKVIFFSKNLLFLQHSVSQPRNSLSRLAGKMWTFVSVWIFLLGLIMSNLGLYAVFNGVATLLDVHTSKDIK